jgi:hypothetical protein
MKRLSLWKKSLPRAGKQLPPHPLQIPHLPRIKLLFRRIMMALPVRVFDKVASVAKHLDIAVI